MKLLTSLFMMALCFELSAIAQTSVNSKIEAVTVYNDRAVITRKAQIPLKAGVHKLQFKNLPSGLIDQSVRVSAEGLDVKIQDVRVETEYVEEILQEKLRLLNNQLDELISEKKELDDRRNILDDQLEFLKGIQVKTQDDAKRDLSTQRPTVDDWQKTLAFLNTNMTAVYTELRTIVKKQKETQEKINQLNVQISDYNSSKTAKNIFIEVQATQDGNLTILPSYMIQNAGWAARYDVRVMTETNQVQLEYHAWIRQNTGEDWNDVDVTLSTARPDVGGEMPELPAWYLNAGNTYTISAGKIRNKKQSNEMEKYEEGGDKPLGGFTEIDVDDAGNEDESTLSVETQTAATASLFHIDAKASIPSDNITHKVTIALLKLNATFHYAATPKLSPFAYLTAVIQNTSELPFIAGSINVFSNDNFVVTSSIKTVSPNEKFFVYLGVDPSIKVERKLIDDFSEATGTFSKTQKITYEYKFAVQNSKKTEQTISVLDHLPISQNEQIKVEQIEPKEKELKKNDDGILIWNFQLKPLERKEWKLKFSIEFPQGTNIQNDLKVPAVNEFKKQMYMK
ncbi:mucoidy inhibitor MuiA family protein [bacterium]|nr:mucoidy inhibitor MuiA family protein [bacterium]